jgi:hypothetical protein
MKSVASVAHTAASTALVKAAFRRIGSRIANPAMLAPWKTSTPAPASWTARIGHNSSTVA